MTSRSSVERTEEALAGIPEQQNLAATFVSQSGAIAQVLQPGGAATIPARMTTQYPIIPGDPVRLARKNGELVVLGPTKSRDATGKIISAGATTCVVEYPSGSGVLATMPFNSAYTPVANDIVLIDWSAKGGVVVAELTELPTFTTPSPSGSAGAQTYHPEPFTALQSGSFRNGAWWTTDVYSSINNIGAWFYGSKIKDTIPDSATILSARIYLPRREVLASGSPMLGRHPSATRPAGTVVVSATSAIAAGATGWTSIPTSLIDNLKSSTGGIGFDHGGYTIWHGVSTDGLSGALDITYQA